MLHTQTSARLHNGDDRGARMPRDVAYSQRSGLTPVARREVPHDDVPDVRERGWRAPRPQNQRQSVLTLLEALPALLAVETRVCEPLDADTVAELDARVLRVRTDSDDDADAL